MRNNECKPHAHAHTRAQQNVGGTQHFRGHGHGLRGGGGDNRLPQAVRAYRQPGHGGRCPRARPSSHAPCLHAAQPTLGPAAAPTQAAVGWALTSRLRPLSAAAPPTARWQQLRRSRASHGAALVPMRGRGHPPRRPARRTVGAGPGPAATPCPRARLRLWTPWCWAQWRRTRPARPQSQAAAPRRPVHRHPACRPKPGHGWGPCCRTAARQTGGVGGGGRAQSGHAMSAGSKGWGGWRGGGGHGAKGRWEVGGGSGGEVPGGGGGGCGGGVAGSSVGSGGGVAVLAVVAGWQCW